MTKETKHIKEQMGAVHHRIPDAFTAFKEGRITRREFIRFATLLGLSATFATACSIQGPANELEALLGLSDDALPAPSLTRGGTLKIGSSIQSIAHPANLAWPESSNILRQVAEYLTLTDENNITTPYLLESWGTNSDVSEWMLTLRKGILFNNGDELTADDVIFNFSQWLDPEIDSSMRGLLSYLDGMNSVEKVDDYTIKLNLITPSIGIPEHLFHYPAAIMHRSFGGDFLKQPIGTGPFTLTEFVTEDRAILTRREDYWQNGPDGDPLPYVDTVEYKAIDRANAVAALQSGQVDTYYNPSPTDWLTLQDDPNMLVQGVSTSQTLVLGMRVDKEPWNDVRVRQALRKIQDREKILALSYLGQGDFGTDAHVAPIHPGYSPREIPEPDLAGAKLLLEEWAADTGGELPIRATIVTKNDEGEKEYAEILQEDAVGTGFEFDLDITDPSGFWDRWNTKTLGISAWTHRPLETMLLPLVYVTDADGIPLPWNETRWSDPEFSALLKEAEAILDVSVRREKIGRLMDIFEERGPIGIPYFKSVWRIHNKRVHSLPSHPTSYDFLTRTWVDI